MKQINSSGGSAENTLNNVTGINNVAVMWKKTIMRNCSTYRAIIVGGVWRTRYLIQGHLFTMLQAHWGTIYIERI